MSSDFNVLSAGLLNPGDYSSWEYYASVGDMVVQFWDDQDPVGMPDFVTRVTLALPVLNGHSDRADFRSMCYQWEGIYAGLQFCTAPYTIRVRNDEHVTDLAPLIEHFLKDTKRIVCANTFWPKSHPSHIGDHLFVARTDLLLAAYASLCKAVAGGTPTYPNYPSPERRLFEEFAAASMRAVPSGRHEGVVEWAGVVERAGVVDVRDLGDYSIHNHRTRAHAKEDGSTEVIADNYTPDVPPPFHTMVSEDRELARAPIRLRNLTDSADCPAVVWVDPQ